MRIAFFLEQLLDYFQLLKAQINEIQILIEKYVQEYFPLEYALFLEILRVSKIIAAVILGEIGPNVEFLYQRLTSCILSRCLS